MKKFLIVLALLVLFSGIVSATDYCVTEAGATVNNGTYSDFGTNDSVTYYKHATETRYLFRKNITSPPAGRQWVIGSAINAELGVHLYGGPFASSDTPYIGTYNTDGAGTDPDAVVSEGACEPVPEFFGIHFEWFDLSSGLIAAILAIGLPMILFKRRK